MTPPQKREKGGNFRFLSENLRKKCWFFWQNSRNHKIEKKKKKGFDTNIEKKWMNLNTLPVENSLGMDDFPIHTHTHTLDPY